MTSISSEKLREFASDCVTGMGDIFWDFESKRDAPQEFRDPHEVAINTVEDTLRRFLSSIDDGDAYIVALREKCASIVATRSLNRTGLVMALMEIGDWTEEGAREVIQLARHYDSRTLRHALVLAEAREGDA